LYEQSSKLIARTPIRYVALLQYMLTLTICTSWSPSVSKAAANQYANADLLKWRLQKIEEPVRSNFPENTDSWAQNFGPKQSEADDFLKSKQANPDIEVFGTDVGIVDAMRFKGAGVLYVRSSCTS